MRGRQSDRWYDDPDERMRSVQGRAQYGGGAGGRPYADSQACAPGLGQVRWGSRSDPWEGRSPPPVWVVEARLCRMRCHPTGEMAGPAVGHLGRYPHPGSRVVAGGPQPSSLSQLPDRMGCYAPSQVRGSWLHPPAPPCIPQCDSPPGCWYI